MVVTASPASGKAAPSSAYVIAVSSSVIQLNKNTTNIAGPTNPAAKPVSADTSALINVLIPIIVMSISLYLG